MGRLGLSIKVLGLGFRSVHTYKMSDAGLTAQGFCLKAEVSLPLGCFRDSVQFC